MIIIAPWSAANILILLIFVKTLAVIRKELPAFQWIVIFSTIYYTLYTGAIANQNGARPKFLSTQYKSVEPRYFACKLAWARPKFSKTWAEPGLVCVLWTRLKIWFGYILSFSVVMPTYFMNCEHCWVFLASTLCTKEKENQKAIYKMPYATITNYRLILQVHSFPDQCFILFWMPEVLIQFWYCHPPEKTPSKRQWLFGLILASIATVWQKILFKFRIYISICLIKKPSSYVKLDKHE